MMNIDAFSQALTSLETVLREPKSDIVRDSCIQRFEYTFELAVNTLRRYLEVSEPAESPIDHLAFKDLIRLGAERGCIQTPEMWFRYRDMRNKSSHAYDAEIAEEIYGILPAFAADSRLLLNELAHRLERL